MSSKLTITECRRQLGDTRLLDEEIVALRDQLYTLAEIVCTMPARASRNMIRAAREEHAAIGEAIEERAAIMQFDGHLSSADAERAAIESAFEWRIH